ncbi:hypothetical protein ACHAW6_009398 [Cyclotella cf. meneghiniana]
MALLTWSPAILSIKRIGKEWGDIEKAVLKATRPGQVVSVDQMISTQPGFVAQLKGKLTTQLYKAATIFVDHLLDLCYIHMMTNTFRNKLSRQNWH